MICSGVALLHYSVTFVYPCVVALVELYNYITVVHEYAGSLLAALAAATVHGYHFVLNSATL